MATTPHVRKEKQQPSALTVISVESGAELVARGDDHVTDGSETRHEELVVLFPMHQHALVATRHHVTGTRPRHRRHRRRVPVLTVEGAALRRAHAHPGYVQGWIGVTRWRN